MTAFCLIHSSGQGPDGWKLLRQQLESRGHRVLTPAFRLAETDQGAAWHAEALLEELRQSSQRSFEAVCVAISPSWQRRAVRAWLDVEPVELPGGHCPRVSRPETLAHILVRIGS